MIIQRSVKELINWYEQKSLILRPEFQRRSNWPPRAKCYFIDTILHEYPSPPLYLRLTIDQKTKLPIREVVDGQQRLTSIIEFYKNELRLDRQAKEYEGLTFAELNPPDQEKFLLYKLGVEELHDETDDFVLEVFHRLNAYGVKLNPQELRHGRYLTKSGSKYTGVFRFEVIEASKRWSVLWEKYDVVSLQRRLRMADDELTAQLFGVILDGVKDGGQPYINSLYERYDKAIPSEAIAHLDQTIKYIIDNFGDVFKTRLKDGPHFLILFAVVAHALFGIPKGDMGEKGNPPLPVRDRSALRDADIARKNLSILAGVLKKKEQDKKFGEFQLASAGSTQRIRSRSKRFIFLYQALLPKVIDA